MKNVKNTWFVAMLTLLVFGGLANAQSDTTKIDTTKTREEATQTKPSAKPSTELIAAAEQYKSSSRELLSIQEKEVDKATAKLAELRILVAQGLVAKVELETSQQSLDVLRTQLEATQKQIADSDHLIAEVREQEELLKTQASMSAKMSLKQVSKPYGTFTVTPTILRYNSGAGWSIGGLAGIQSFFSSSFGRSLPTSAVGQSATHNQLGYDHRNAVDVAVHPDSIEGKTLINYLKSQGIPFLAFRAAIPGVATGPHIHIGNPSHRLS